MPTREGNDVYPIAGTIRACVPDQSLCKGCAHLGDLCHYFGRDFETFAVNDIKKRVVVKCNGFEQVENKHFI